MSTSDILIIIVSCLNLILMVVIILLLIKSKKTSCEAQFATLTELIKVNTSTTNDSISRLQDQNNTSQSNLRSEINSTILQLGSTLREGQSESSKNLTEKLTTFENRLTSFQQETGNTIDGVKSDIQTSLGVMSQNIATQLDVMQKTNTDSLSAVKTDTQEKLTTMSEFLSKQLNVMQNTSTDALNTVKTDTQQKLSTMSEFLSKQLNVMQNASTEALNTVKTDTKTHLEMMSQNIGSHLGLMQKNSTESLDAVKTDTKASLNTMSQNIANQLEVMQKANTESLGAVKTDTKTSLDTMSKYMNQQLEVFSNRIETMERSERESLDTLRTEIRSQLQSMNNENSNQLEKIRQTVDEKLQSTLEKRLTESFKLVSDNLESVHQSVGEMRKIADEVGGLRKVMSNVKSRGILGETQLNNILSNILTPDQYETNVSTVPNSKAVVEFAVKLPGAGDSPVYLPIDSKFPGDSYSTYRDAVDSGDKDAATNAWKALENRLKNEAKDIRDKYISVPYTTNFGIMFLPFEGLYATAVDHGMVEVLQREYQITIAGPSTMAAMLNTISMGFRTLAIQKKSDEVWKVLGAIKTEFGKFEDTLKSAQKKIQTADEEISKLLTTRTNKMNVKLRQVEELDSEEAGGILGIEQ